MTPSLNQGAFIYGMLESVRRQQYAHIEHIVVDGGSTDGTLDILREAETTYELRWLSEPDDGMYQALNKGLALVRGEILGYLNTDDRYFPWTVEIAVRALEEDSRAAFVFGDMVNVADGKVSLLLYPPFRLDYIRHVGFLGQPTVFWRRRVAEALGGFDESLELVADCDFWIRMGARFRGRKINEVLALERDHPQAKRVAQPQELRDELRLFRAQQPGGSALGRLSARFHAFVWRRIALARFLWAAIRPGSNGAYSCFVREGGRVDVSLPRVAASLLPGVGGRFSRGLIQLTGFDELP
jgi:glycosyltransferase involved in cell wall biosynthesis